MKGSTRARAILAASAVAVIAAAGCQPPTAWVPELLDLGTPPGSMSTASQITFSANGTRMLFVAFDGDFGPTDTNGAFDVYVRDLITGTNELVSVNADGTNSGQGPGLDPYSIQTQLSADGTKVVFVSEASDLVPSGTSGRHIDVRDLVAGTTHLVTADAAGTGVADGLSDAPAFSPDGTKVAFLSDAGDLTPEPVSSPIRAGDRAVGGVFGRPSGAADRSRPPRREQQRHAGPDHRLTRTPAASLSTRSRLPGVGRLAIQL
jgi:Tol biopolymer transport system component